MRVIVAGGRNYNDYENVKKNLDALFKNLNKEKLIIISGGAPGADEMGERYAKENGYKLERFPADWKRFGNAAGPIRNRQMAQVGNACVCFDTGGRGTADMIRVAKEFRLNLRVIDCKK